MPRPSKTLGPRLCRTCSTVIATNRPRAFYCSPKCRPSFQEVVGAHGKDVPFKSKGTIGELAVTLDLLKQGFEVFKSVAPHASCDLIALKKDKMIRVEVKSATTTTLVDGVSVNYRTAPSKLNEGNFDLLAGYTSQGIVYDPLLESFE